MIDRLKADLADAMRRKETVAVSTIRMLMSQIQYARIEAKRELTLRVIEEHDRVVRQAKRELTQDDYIAVLQRGVKTRREAIEQYEKGGRKDLADKERAEIAVIERYLPAAMSAEELAQAVDALLKEIGVTEKKDLGRAMKEFMGRHRGRVDGKSVNALIASRLK